MSDEEDSDKRVLNAKRNASLRLSESMGMISPLIHIGQFKVDAAHVIDGYHMDSTQQRSKTVQGIAADLGIDEEVVKELEDVCSPDKLKCDMEEDIIAWNDIETAPKNTGLATVDSWHEACLKRNHAMDTFILKSKYTKYSCMLENSVRDIEPKDENDVIRPPETVITVSVNFPRNARRFKHCGINIRVLGSQKLSDLRDIIPCALDEQPIGKFTDNPDHPRDIKCRELFRSGYFFIEDTFYNDMRDPSNTDMGKHITDWAKSSDVVISPPSRSVKMEDYTFDDLHLRLGSPYLYMHQGDCEHILIFKDIRLLHPDDCLSRSAYPVAISRARFKTASCKACNFLFATWMTRYDELSDEDPSFFCDQCFRMLHYHKDGTKAGNFEAYPFVSRESVNIENARLNESASRDNGGSTR